MIARFVLAPAPDPGKNRVRRALHFIGFRGEEYWSAVKVWGRPDLIHRCWDRRAQRDIGEDDIVIFARGDESLPLAHFNADDIDESFLLPIP